MGCPLLQKIKRSSRLPSPPGTALRILQLCQEEDICLTTLADTLASDPALSLRMLTYANSSLVGMRREITNIREAVVLLGIRMVRVMALSFSLVSQRDSQACRGFDYDRFWAHSLACAVAAKHLAAQSPPPPPEEAFSAGLLSHVGKLVFAVGLPDAYPEVLQVAGGTLGRTERYESSCLGASHHEIGAAMLSEWGIPQRLSDAVTFQGQPSKAPDKSAVGQLAVILNMATNVADILCEVGDEAVMEGRRETLANSSFVKGGESLDSFLEPIRRNFEELTDFLALVDATKRTPEEIQAEAGTVLSELSINAQLEREAFDRENRVLQEKAFTDGLTCIPNRAAFDDRLKALWNEALEKRAPLALILLDVDHFKNFNDTYGHTAGDEVLKAVAERLTVAVRNVDFVARYGGEEFAAILPNTDRLTTAYTAVKMRKAIESSRIREGERAHRVTISVGATLLPIVGPPFTPARLIEVADQQLYQAKERGRNRCCMTQLRVVQPQPAAAPC